MATVPGVPTITSAIATSLTNGVAQFSVAYTPPISDGGSPITSYYVNRGFPGTVAALANPYVFTDTNFGTPYNADYRFSIAAVNIIGVGAYTSNALVSAVTDRYTIAVQSPTVLRVAFNAGTMPAPPKSVSSAYVGDALNPKTWWIYGAGLPVFATSVTEISSYIFDITFPALSTAISLSTAPPSAANALQLTDNSKFQVFAVYRNLAPSAPVLTTATPASGSVTVNFIAPASDPSYPVTYYEYSLDGGSTFYTATIVLNSFTVSGLTNGTSYSFTLRALNTLGSFTAGGVYTATSAWSNTVAATPGEAPSNPTITAITATSSSLTVFYTAPASDGGSPITSYEYRVLGVVTDIGLTNPFSVTGLPPGTTVTFELRAVNAFGPGPWSTPVSGTTGGSIPSAPTITSVTPSINALTVAFTPPVDDGGSPITDYEVSLNGGAYASVGTTSPFVLSGLSNATLYTVVLRAVNEVGPGTDSASVAALTPTTYTVLAVGDRVVRIQLDSSLYPSPPLHVSSTGQLDALNPRTWQVTQFLETIPVTSKTLTVLSVLGSDPYTYDICTLEHFARANGPQLNLSAPGGLKLESGGTIPVGLDSYADFNGSIQSAESTPNRKTATRGYSVRDIANVPTPYEDLIGGTLVINAAGDYESMSGEQFVRKLVLRRLISKRGDFFHLPNYGAGLGVKETFSTANLRMLAKEIEMQVLLEPEVEQAKATLTYQAADSTLTVQVRARMRSTGQITSISMNLPTGSIQF